MSEAAPKAVAAPKPMAVPKPGRKSVHEMIESEAFKSLVAKRWTLNVVLLIGLFVTYYGYILLIGYDKPLMSSKIGVVTTLGIPLGVGVIVVAWILTLIYVAYSNSKYDPEVERLKKELE